MGAFMPDPVIIQRTIQVEHIKIESRKPFSGVKTALESLVAQLDARIFVLLQYGKSDRARKELERGPELSIFNSEIMADCCRSSAAHATRCNTTSAIADCSPDDATSAASRSICAAARRALRKQCRSRDLRI
jgi:hypothetical protein